MFTDGKRIYNDPRLQKIDVDEDEAYADEIIAHANNYLSQLSFDTDKNLISIPHRVYQKLILLSQTKKKSFSQLLEDAVYA